MKILVLDGVAIPLIGVYILEKLMHMCNKTYTRLFVTILPVKLQTGNNTKMSTNSKMDTDVVKY